MIGQIFSDIDLNIKMLDLTQKKLRKRLYDRRVYEADEGQTRG